MTRPGKAGKRLRDRRRLCLIDGENGEGSELVRERGQGGLAWDGVRTMKVFGPTALLLVIVSMVSALIVTVSPADARQRHKWWQSGDIKAELNITDDQSDAIEEVYQTARPQLRALMNALNTEEEALSLLIDADHTQETEVTEQIDKVEAARGALGKERLLMVYRMHRELSTEQRAGLREWMDQNRQRTRRSSSSR